MANYVVKMSLSTYTKWIKQLGPRFGAAARRGALAGGLRSIPILHRYTDKAPPANPQGIGEGGAFNTGAYKRGWKVQQLTDGALIYNAMRYAGIIEGDVATGYGRRPGAHFPPLKYVQRWAQRRLGLSAKEAARAAYPIARAIAKRGLKGRFVMRGAMMEIQAAFEAAVAAELEKELAAVPTGGGHTP